MASHRGIRLTANIGSSNSQVHRHVEVLGRDSLDSEGHGGGRIRVDVPDTIIGGRMVDTR